MLPQLNIKSNNNKTLKTFAGLDKRDKISDFSLTDMTNISATSAPALAPREGRRLICNASGATQLCAPEYSDGELDSFTGVRNGQFYYKGREIAGSLTEGEKSIADFNGKICIFPDKLYYDYLPDPDTGEISTALKSMEKTVTHTNVKFFTSYDEITGEYSSYVQASNSTFSGRFVQGDSITISGSSIGINNTHSYADRERPPMTREIVSAVVEKVDGTRLYLLLYNKYGEKVTFANITESRAITFKKAVPDMDSICVHNNRLWGTAPDGKYVYASKLGDCTDFNSFQGLSDDSWFGYIGTGGNFTGICSFRTGVVAFKRNHIHHIYGDAPANFSVPKQINSGCIDKRSICQAGGLLYYLSPDGFRCYSGGEPFDISPQLTEKYTACISVSNGTLYYAVACSGSRCDLLVYNTQTNIWVREDSTPFISFCCFNGKIYGLADGEMLLLEDGDETVEWSAVTKDFTYDMTEYKGVAELWLRAEAKEPCKISVLISHGGQEFVPCGETTLQGFEVFRVPVRFKKCNSYRLKICGQGKGVIHDIEIVSYKGGKVYGQIN